MPKNRSLISKDVTIRDVAAEAGVSISLVSFVLNAQRGPNGEYLCCASQATAQRIVAAAEKLGYHKNAAASTLRSGHSNTIGVIVADITNTCFGAIYRKIENLSMEAGYLTIVSSSDDRPERLSLLLDKFLHAGVDGIIVSPCSGAEAAIKKVMDRDIPIVLIDRDLPHLENVGRVMLDNLKSGRMATGALIKRGYRKIELIRYESLISTLLEREAGYVKEMQKHGLDEYIRVRVVSRETMSRDIVSVIMAAHEEGAEAVILPTNTITISGVSAIKTLGYKVPEDLAVVGFDQSDRAGIFQHGIFFVDQPTDLVAEYSFRMLLAAMESGKQTKSIILEPLLHI